MIEQALETWSRCADEGTRPYRAFTIYLSLDADRSLVKVGQKLGISKTIVERWSSDYNWVSRARDYDAHVSELRQARLATARERLVDEQIAIAAEMFSLVKSRMSGLSRKQVNAMGIARMFYVACQAVQGVFGDEQPLAKQVPKIVFISLNKNQPRNFEAEAEARDNHVQ